MDFSLITAKLTHFRIQYGSPSEFSITDLGLGTLVTWLKSLRIRTPLDLLAPSVYEKSERNSLPQSLKRNNGSFTSLTNDDTAR